jgi:MFS family permease
MTSCPIFPGGVPFITITVAAANCAVKPRWHTPQITIRHEGPPRSTVLTSTLAGPAALFVGLGRFADTPLLAAVPPHNGASARPLRRRVLACRVNNVPLIPHMSLIANHVARGRDTRVAASSRVFVVSGIGAAIGPIAGGWIGAWRTATAFASLERHPPLFLAGAAIAVRALALLRRDRAPVAQARIEKGHATVGQRRRDGSFRSRVRWATTARPKGSRSTIRRREPQP